MNNSARCSNAARQLGDLLAQLPVGDSTESWNSIEKTAQILADGLRVRDGKHSSQVSYLRVAFGTYTEFVPQENNHTSLGRTLLPQTLTALLKNAVGVSPIPSAAHTAAIHGILRIGANLCMDHGKSQ